MTAPSAPRVSDVRSAYDLLVQATAQLRLTRAEHDAVRAALDSLLLAATPKYSGTREAHPSPPLRGDLDETLLAVRKTSEVTA